MHAKSLAHLAQAMCTAEREDRSCKSAKMEEKEALSGRETKTKEREQMKAMNREI